MHSERTGQVIKLKSNFTATIAKSLSIQLYKHWLLQQHIYLNISKPMNLKIFSNNCLFIFSIKNSSEVDL